jgi:DNA-binding FadR family transcriptional regulator
MWVEGAMTQADRRNKNIQPPNAVLYNQQMHDIKLFLQLTWDTDYNNIANNIIDGNWKVYKIDSSRSFRNDPNLRRPETLTMFRRSSVDALKNLDRDELDKAMAPWLKQKAIDALWERRNKLLEVIRERIETRTEAAVLF